MSCLSTNKAVGMDQRHAKFHKEAADMLLDQFIVKIICFQKNLNLLSWNHNLKKVWALRFISATSGWCYWEINTLPISNTLPSAQKNDLLFKYAQVTDSVLTGMDERMLTGMILKDLQKAFDILNHKILFSIYINGLP